MERFFLPSPRNGWCHHRRDTLDPWAGEQAQLRLARQDSVHRAGFSVAGAEMLLLPWPVKLKKEHHSPGGAGHVTL